MGTLFRQPLLAVGLVLTFLGAGNWYAAQSKLHRYRGALIEQHGKEPVVGHSDFPQLTAAMNANLLRPLRYGSGEYERVEAKVDFYHVVHRGGLVLALLGLSCLVTGSLRWRQHPPTALTPQPRSR